eukprot:2541971-Rhodomonas_salina.2
MESWKERRRREKRTGSRGSMTELQFGCKIWCRSVVVRRLQCRGPLQCTEDQLPAVVDPAFIRMPPSSNSLPRKRLHATAQHGRLQRKANQELRCARYC